MSVRVSAITSSAEGSAGLSGSCNPEKPRTHCAVEIQREIQSARKHQRKVCLRDRLDTVRDYIERSGRHKIRLAFRKAVALHRHESGFQRCGCRRKRDRHRNGNRLACSSD